MSDKQVMTSVEFKAEISRLEGCVVDRISIDEQDRGVVCIVISDGVDLYKFWTPVLDDGVHGTLPLGVERFVDSDEEVDPVELVIDEGIPQR